MYGSTGKSSTPPEKQFAESNKESIPIRHAFFEINEVYEIKYLNKNAEDLLKNDKRKLTGQLLEKVFPQIINTAGYHAIIEAQTNRLEVQVNYIDPETSQQVNLSAEPTTGGVCVLLNYSSPTAYETPFAYAEEQYRSLVENSPDVITRWNKRLKLVYANQALETKTGAPNEALIGKDKQEMGQPDTIALPWMQKLTEVFETGEPATIENSLLTANGLIHFHSRLVPEKNANHEIVTILSIGRDITDRKATEQELQDQINLTHTIAKTIPDILTIIELPSRKTLYINRDTLIAAGYVDNEIKNLTPEEGKIFIVHPDDRHTIEGFYEKLNALPHDDLTAMEYRFRFSDDEWHTLYTRGKVLKRDERGVPTRALLTGQDITLRRKAEKELLEAKDQLAKQATRKYLSLFNAIDEAFSIIEVVFDANNQPVDCLYVEVNPAFGKQSGLTHARGRKITELISEVEPIWFESYGKVVKTGKSVRFENYSKALDKWFEVYAFRIDELEEHQIAVLFTDTTERRKAEEALRRKEAELAAVFEVLPVGVGLIDTEGQFVLMNELMHAFIPNRVMPARDRVQKWYGTNPDGSPVLPHHFPDARALRGEQTVPGIELLYKPDADTEIWTTVAGIPFKDSQGEIIGSVSVVTDISENKKLEQKQAYLLDLNDTLRSISDPLELERRATLTAMNYFKADRCYYCEIESDHAIIRSDASKDGLPSVVGTYPLSSLAIHKKVIDVGKPFVVPDAKSTDILDEPLRQICLGLQAVSFINVPVIKNEKAAGILCLVQSTPRKWTETEIELATETAERTWAAVERAKIEKELRRREAELTSVQEIGGVGGIDIDILHGLRSWRSAEYLRLHGLPANTTLEQHEDWLKRLHPEDRAHANLTLQNTLASTSSQYISEYRIIRPNDGQTRWILAKGQIERDADGQPVRLIGAHIDITDRKIIEEKLRESEERKAYLLKLSDAIRLLENPAEVQSTAARVIGEHLQVDRAFYAEISTQDNKEYYVIEEAYHTKRITKRTGRFPFDNFGSIAQELHLGHTVVVDNIEEDALISSTDIPKYQSIDVNAFVALPLLKNDKLVASFAVHQARPRIWKPEEIKLIEETAERTWAIVERAHAEEALREAQENYLVQLEQEVNLRTAELKESKTLLQSVFDSSINAINVCRAVRNEAGEIIDFQWILVNSEGSHYAKGVDFIGKRYTEIFPGIKLTPVFDRYKQVVETGKADDFESYYEGEGLKGWFRNIVVKFSDGLLITTEDVTERKKAEEQLKQLNLSILHHNKELEEKNAELASFAFIASHDLKEPLRKITVFSNMLVDKESQALSASGKEYLTRMKNAVQRMDLLIEDILSLSRVQAKSQKFERVNLNDVLQKAREEYIEQITALGATIESDTLPVITGAASPLFYLFNNLLSNALKFQKPGNKPLVRITVSQVKGIDIDEVTDKKNEDFYKISVIDNGIGFENIHARQIFQIFKRLHGKSDYPGTGIGLAICKKIMDIHNGYITSSSQLNEGAVFSCYFPIDFHPVNNDETGTQE